MKKSIPNHAPSQVKTSPKNDVNSILPSCEKFNLEKKWRRTDDLAKLNTFVSWQRCALITAKRRAP